MNVPILKSKMALKEMSVERLSELVGIGKVAMYRRFNGELEFKANEIKSISDVLDLNIEDVNVIFFNNEVS